MSIAAINEQLLRSIGVGVALARVSDLTVSYRNPAFAEWFAEPGPEARLTDLIPDLSAEDIAAARRVLYALVEMGIEAREREPASS